MLAEWEKQKRLKQVQHKLQTDLNVVVTEEHLPQALMHTQTELKNMLHEGSAFYERVLNLGATLSTPGAPAASPRGLVSSRERLQVKDIINGSATPGQPGAKKGSVDNGGISHNST